jgi:hypothetical protein
MTERKVGKPFQKGQSGNPGGRPKEIVEVKELARQHTPEAIATLARIMMNAKAMDAARVAAANALLDRGWGKAAQSLDVTVKHSFVDTLRDLERIRRETVGIVGEGVAQVGERPAAVRH